MQTVPINAGPDAAVTAKVIEENIYKYHFFTLVVVLNRDLVSMGKFWPSLFRMLLTKIPASFAYHLHIEEKPERLFQRINKILKVVLVYNNSQKRLARCY